MDSNAIFRCIRACRGAVLVLLLAGICALPAMSQDAGFGSITGTVTDPNHAVIPGATVTVLQEDTGVKRDLETTSSGSYSATFLKPGKYEVSVSAKGFAKFDQKNIPVLVGQVLTINAELPLAGGQDTVTVTGEAPLLDTEKVGQSQEIGQELLASLPINGRRFDNVVLLTPNVAPDGASGLIAYRGVSGLYNTNLIDGANNNQAFFSEARGRAIGAPYVYSTDSIQEFQTAASSYGAEFGQAAGGQINAVSKYGTNKFHGDLFYDLRYPSLNALDPYGKSRKLFTQPVHQQHQFGGSIGGPIVKDKAFFFLTYDGFRKVNPIVYLSNFDPTTATCPAPLTAAQCTAALNYVTGKSVGMGNTANEGIFPRLVKQDILFPKLDLQLNEKNHISAEGNIQNFNEPNGYNTSNTVTNGGVTQNGVATASYADKGCGVADPITATVTLGGASVSKTGTLTVLPASAGSVKFVAADTTNIALKGTGGIGRQEFSTLSFQVFDTTGSKVAGNLVDFVFADTGTATTVGGLTLNPASATSVADGTVTTLVSGGTIPTSVRVVATIHGGSPAITSLSNVLVVSTGVPDQPHFSLATEIGNCEGLDFDQVCSIVTATLGDHFGNPVPDGTAVNFTTEGGVIDASCLTGSLLGAQTTPAGQTTNSKVGPGSGRCSVTLLAGNPRPANGRVTVLAYALGEESLFDANGNNVFDASDTFADKSPDIFRDDNENGVWTAGEPCIGPNSNRTCSTAGDGQYNGVLRNPQLPSTQILRVSDQLVQIFSGSHASVIFTPAAISCTVGGTANVQVRVTDEIGNVMPAGTTIAFSTSFDLGSDKVSVFPTSVTVNNVVLAVGQPLLIPTYNVTVACAGSGMLFATVTTPGKVETTASVPIN